MAELTNDILADLIEGALDVARYTRDGARVSDYQTRDVKVDTISAFLQISYLEINVRQYHVFYEVLAALGFGFYSIGDVGEGVEWTLAASYQPTGEIYPKFLKDLEALLNGIIQILEGNTSLSETAAARIIVEPLGSRSIWKVTMKIYADEITNALMGVLTACGLNVLDRNDQSGFYAFIQ